MITRMMFVTLLLFAIACAACADDGEATLERLMESKKISLEFKETPLSKIIDHLRDLSKFNLVVDKQEIGDKLETLVSLNVKDLSFKNAFTLLLAFEELGYFIKKNVIFVTTQEIAQLRPIATRIYDVRELQVTLNDFPGSLEDLSSLLARQRGETWKDPKDRERSSISLEAVVELIQSNIEPNSWESEEARIDAIGGTLVIRHTPRTHARIVQFIRDLQQFATITVRVDAWLVPSDGGMLGTKGKPIPIAGWRKRLAERSEPVEHVSVTAYNSQRVNLHSGSMVKFNAEGLSGDLKAGLMLDVRPTYSSRQKAVRMELRFAKSAFEASKQLSIYRFRTHVTVPENTAIVVGGARYGLPGRTLVLAAGVRSSRARPRTERPADAIHLKILTKLNKKISVDYTGLSLQDVMDGLRKTLGVNIVIDPELIRERTEDELKVDLRVTDLEAHLVLKLILDLKQLGWMVSNGVVMIRSREHVGGDSMTRVWDVRDLVSPIPDFAESFKFSGQRGLHEEEPLSEDSLMNLIRDNVHPDTWEGENTIKSMYGSLVVRNKGDVLSEVDNLLTQLRKVTSTTVNVEVIALKDPKSYMEKNGFDKQLVSTLALDKFLDKAVKGRHIEIVGRTNLHGWNTQLFGLFVGRQWAEKGFKTVAQKGKDENNPKITYVRLAREEATRIQERGFKLDVRPVLSMNGEEVHLTIRSEASGVDSVQRFASTVQFPTSKTVILGGARAGGVVLVLRVHPVK